MKEARYFYVPDAPMRNELPDEEAQHAIRVLRLSAGDEIYLMDGQGCFYLANVTFTSNKHCLYDIQKALPQKKSWLGHIQLAIAPTKMMERMEWMAEKATEVGFDELSFISCRFSERHKLRVDRIDKIVVSAIKQSRKAWKPIVNEMASFEEFVKQPREGVKFIAHCYNEIERKDLFDELMKQESDAAITVLIGPEGDFSIDEVQMAMAHGYESISLGNSRLRTETAGLMAVVMANLVRRN